MESCAGQRIPESRRFTADEQQQRERAWDDAADAVERELRQPRAHRTQAARRETQKRITAAFARFSAEALDLRDAIELLTHDFLPVGTRLARWARHFDPALTMPDIIQACRNAWTACGLQPLLGQPVDLTPSILGYSMLYPYTDNFLDQADISAATPSITTSRRFRERLAVSAISPRTSWRQRSGHWSGWSRDSIPGPASRRLRLHAGDPSRAGAQPRPAAQPTPPRRNAALSCAKGGTSVLADACLARGWLTGQESPFAFDWGVLLQLGDDVQDVREDLERGSMTLFSQPAMRGEALDERVIQLLTFAEHVGRKWKRCKAVLRC